MTDNSTPAPFQARQEVLDLLPAASGNDINGLGEGEKRNASPVLWHDPDILAHGDLQKWFFANGTSAGASKHRAANMEFTAKPLPELAAGKADWTPQDAAARVKAAALELEADIVGITRLNQDWVFEGYEADYQWIIVLAVAMDWQCLKTAPSEKSQTEVQNQYGRGTRAPVFQGLGVGNGAVDIKGVFHPVGDRHADAEGLVLGPDGAHRVEHFQGIADVVFQAAAISIAALVRGRREEFMQQIAVRGMNFDQLEQSTFGHAAVYSPPPVFWDLRY